MNNGTRVPLRDRFATKYVPEPNSGCWLWTASVSPLGYGWIGTEGRRGRTMFAHRASYELHRGPIPDGLHVCHHCDTPSCVNPEHLFLGTDADNLADMRKKGRGFVPPPRRGASNHNTKLAPAAVLAIHKDTRPSRAIAESYGVSIGAIEGIKKGRNWGWLTGKELH